MTRLIDADALREQFKDRSLEDFTYLHFIDAIDNAPTVERPKGKWIPNDTLFHHGKTSWRCSVCNDVIDDVPTCMNKPLYKFCPNCGAEMRGGQDNDPN